MADGSLAELQRRLLKVLTACGPFESNAILRDFFGSDPRLLQWENQLPERTSVQNRVVATLSFLYKRPDSSTDVSALSLFLQVLIERNEDACRGALEELVAADVGRVVRRNEWKALDTEAPRIRRWLRILFSLALLATVLLSITLAIWLLLGDECRTPSLEFRVDLQRVSNVLARPNSIFLVDPGETLTVRAVLDGRVPSEQETYSCAWTYIGDGGIVARQGCAAQMAAGADASEDLVRVEISQEGCSVSLVEVLHIANR